MRCFCCNDLLSDYETSLKSPTTGDYLDTCIVCLKESGVIGVSSQSSEGEEDVYEEF